MDLDQTFQEIIRKLQNGERVHLRPTQEELKILGKQWQNALDTKSEDKISKILCILEHSLILESEFTQLWIRSIEIFQTKDLLILLLGSFQNIVVGPLQKQGNRLPIEALNALDSTIQFDDPEVLEWALRAIDSLGAQSLYFKNKVLEKRPSFLQKLTKKHKVCDQLINHLCQRWGVK